MQLEYKDFCLSLILSKCSCSVFEQMHSLFFLTLFKVLRWFSAKLLQVLLLLGGIQTKCISSFIASGYSSSVCCCQEFQADVTVLIVSGSCLTIWFVCFLTTMKAKTTYQTIDVLCLLLHGIVEQLQTYPSNLVQLIPMCFFGFLVGIKILSQVEPTQTHSEWFM